MLAGRRTGFDPASCRVDRVIGKHGGVLHVALAQTHTLSVFQVDCRYQDHRDESLGNIDRSAAIEAESGNCQARSKRFASKGP